MIRKYWSVISLILITLVALTYTVALFGFHHWSPKGQLLGVFYWFYVKSEQPTLTSTALGLIIVIALISLVLWFILNFRRYVKHWLGCSTLLLALFPCISLSLFYLVFFFPSGTKHLDEVRQHSELYRLAYWDSSPDGNYYKLFECDSIGIICSEICSSRVENNDVESLQPKILISGSPQIISIVDSGKTLCSAEVKP